MKKLTLILFTVTLTLAYHIAFATDDDWITDNSNKLCHGYYKEPNYISLDLLSAEEKSTINIESDNASLTTDGQSSFTGNVLVAESNKKLHCDHLVIVRDKNADKLAYLKATGNVKMTEPGLKLEGDQAEYFVPESKKIITNATFRIYSSHGRGEAKSITTLGNDKLILPNASYTTCAPGNNLWQINGSNVTFNSTTGRGEVWHSFLMVKKIPVFYWPYINFPIDDRRQTGFLHPIFERNSANGASIHVPFYWNIAPNYDATITPVYMSKRNFKINNEFRYLGIKNSGTINFNFLTNDKEYNIFQKKNLNSTLISDHNDFRVKGLRELDHRYFLSVNHTTYFNPNITFTTDFSKTWDDNYLQDFPTDLSSKHILRPANLSQGSYQDSINHIKQNASLEYANQYGDLKLSLNQYQTLHPYTGPKAEEQYRTLPSITSNLHKNIGEYSISFAADYNHFNYKQNSAPDHKTTGQRLHFRPAVSNYILNKPAYFIKPNIEFDIIKYRNNLTMIDKHENKPSNPSRLIPILSLDSGLRFERQVTFRQGDFTQTLEPRMYLLYVPYKNQQKLPIFDSAPYTFDYNQLFRDNRYSGSDRISEAKQASFGITSDFYVNKTGEEKASLSFGRILYFRDREEHIPEVINNKSNWSPFVGIAKYKINPKWNIEANFVRENLDKATSGSILARYSFAANNVINFGYQFQRSNNVEQRTGKPAHIRQLVNSFAFRMRPNIGLLGKLEYDVQQKRVMKMLAGIEHHSCCTVARILWFKYLQQTDSTLVWKKYEHAIGFQIVFKGLGANTGNMQYSSFSSEIQGYHPKDDEF